MSVASILVRGITDTLQQNIVKESRRFKISRTKARAIQRNIGVTQTRQTTNIGGKTRHEGTPLKRISERKTFALSTFEEIGTETSRRNIVPFIVMHPFKDSSNAAITNTLAQPMHDRRKEVRNEHNASAYTIHNQNKTKFCGGGKIRISVERPIQLNM